MLFKNEDFFFFFLRHRIDSTINFPLKDAEISVIAKWTAGLLYLPYWKEKDRDGGGTA